MKAESEKGTCCVEVKFAHLLKEILLVRKLIWQFPRAHHDRHDSHAPHVPGEVVDVVCHYFRGHVQRSAHRHSDLCEVGGFAVLSDASESEVGNFDFARGRDENVLRFDVSVGNSLAGGSM